MTSATEPQTSRVRAIALVALVALLVAFAILYFQARSSESGTSRDESPAAEAGLDVVALTDHDTTAGWAEAAAALPPGLTLVPGAELSCRWHGGEPSIALHLLAYLFDPADPALCAELARVRTSREERAEKMVALMRADGLDVTWAEIQGYAAGGTLCSPTPGDTLPFCNDPSVYAGTVTCTSLPAEDGETVTCD